MAKVLQCRYCGCELGQNGCSCFHGCFEQVPAIHIGNREGWFYVGNRGKRVDRIHAQCENCGGIVIFNESMDRYECGGYPSDMYQQEIEPELPCGTIYDIDCHVAHDTIF